MDTAHTTDGPDYFWKTSHNNNNNKMLEVEAKENSNPITGGEKNTLLEREGQRDKGEEQLKNENSPVLNAQVIFQLYSEISLSVG